MKFSDALIELIARARRKYGDDAGEQYIWNIVAALRGPDTGDDLLKEKTTARVRAILLGEKSGGWINGSFFNGHPLSEDQIKARNELLTKRGMFHLLVHFEWAMQGLSKLGYSVPEAELYCSENTKPEDKD